MGVCVFWGGCVCASWGGGHNHAIPCLISRHWSLPGVRDASRAGGARCTGRGFMQSGFGYRARCYHRSEFTCTERISITHARMGPCTFCRGLGGPQSLEITTAVGTLPLSASPLLPGRLRCCSWSRLRPCLRGCCCWEAGYFV